MLKSFQGKSEENSKSKKLSFRQSDLDEPKISRENIIFRNEMFLQNLVKTGKEDIDILDFLENKEFYDVSAQPFKINLQELIIE
jgi:hypothetical protein